MEAVEPTKHGKIWRASILYTMLDTYGGNSINGVTPQKSLDGLHSMEFMFFKIDDQKGTHFRKPPYYIHIIYLSLIYTLIINHFNILEKNLEYIVIEHF